MDNTTTAANLVTRIMDFEEGNLEEDEVIELFRYLINTGTVYHLQGHYGRLAQSFIEAGLLERPS